MTSTIQKRKTPLDNRTEQTPKAQTPKPCRRCRRTIQKGERYHLVLGQRSGHWKALITCSECHGELAIAKAKEAQS